LLKAVGIEQATLFGNRMTNVTAACRILFWPLVLGVGILSVLPTDAIPSEFMFWDKAQHTLGFAILTLMGLMAYGRGSRGLLLGILAYGALIEIVQHFLPWRHGDLLDFLADALGVAVIVALSRCQKNLSKRL
jgi:hypothetical protein